MTISYRPARVGVSQSEALAEAYAHAKAGEPEIVTLALYHPAFIDTKGRPTAVYVVRDFAPFEATLEDDAPLHPGETVVFQPVPFEFSRPEESDTGAPPEVTIEIDNVTRELVPHIKAAAASKEPITLMVRIYLASDTSAPHETPPLTLVLRNASISGSRISARAGYGDLANRKFPKVEYNRATHAALYG